MMFLVRQILLAGLILMIAAARADLPTEPAVGGMIKRSEVENIVHRGHSKIAEVIDVTPDDFVELHRASTEARVDKVAMDLGPMIGIAACLGIACTVVSMGTWCGGIGRNSKVCAQ